MNGNFSSLASSLLATYASVSPQELKDANIEGMLLLRKGPSSLAFGDDARVIKIIIANHQIVTPVIEEYKSLKEFEGLKGDNFILPQALDCGNNPDYIVMSNIGECLAKHPDRANQFLRASAAMGEFAGKIWAADHLIHTDIHMTNFTVPNCEDGKIGIIDIAAVKRNKTPEEMFWCPLLRTEISCPVIAEKFTEISGVMIDFDKVKSIVEKRLLAFVRASDPAQGKAVTEIVSANLLEWQKSLRSRPVLRANHGLDRLLLR